MKRHLILLTLIVLASLAVVATRPDISKSEEAAAKFYYQALWINHSDAPSYGEFRDWIVRVNAKHPGYLENVGVCSQMPGKNEWWSCLDSLEWR